MPCVREIMVCLESNWTRQLFSRKAMERKRRSRRRKSERERVRDGEKERVNYRETDELE